MLIKRLIEIQAILTESMNLPDGGQDGGQDEEAQSAHVHKCYRIRLLFNFLNNTSSYKF